MAGEMPSLLADSQILELFPFIANGEETEVSEFLDQLDENQIHELFLGLVEETLLQEADESHTRLFVQYLSDAQVLKLYQDLCDTEDEAAASLRHRHCFRI